MPGVTPGRSHTDLRVIFHTVAAQTPSSSGSINKEITDRWDKQLPENCPYEWDEIASITPMQRHFKPMDERWPRVVAQRLNAALAATEFGSQGRLPCRLPQLQHIRVDRRLRLELRGRRADQRPSVEPLSREDPRLALDAESDP